METTIHKIGRYIFSAEAVHCDINQNLFLSTLCHDLLRAADMHSTERQFGMNYLKSINKTWVLSRLVLEIFHLPQAYDEFCIETWVESVMHHFTARNFAIVNHHGQALGYCRSIWSMIDTISRHPTDMLLVRDGSISNYIENSKACPIAGYSNWKTNPNSKCVQQFTIRYSDCDSNGHFNSIKYIDHVLDIWDMDFHKNYSICRLEIAYQTECHFGDNLLVYCEEIQKEEQGQKEFRIHLNKLNPTSHTETEVSKLKVLFVKQE